MTQTPVLRPRRSCLAVPGSSIKMMGKAQGLPADQVFLDLEDSVAPLAKEGARANIVAALNEGDWSGKTRVVRVNDLTTQWTYRDVITVVEGAGANLDAIMLPKVQSAEQVVWLDLLLSQIEATVKAANATLASHQRVSSWRLWPEADFPRTHTLKVKRDQVRAWAAVDEPIPVRQG